MRVELVGGPCNGRRVEVGARPPERVLCGEHWYRLRDGQYVVAASGREEPDCG